MIFLDTSVGVFCCYDCCPRFRFAILMASNKVCSVVTTCTSPVAVTLLTTHDLATRIRCVLSVCLTDAAF